MTAANIMPLISVSLATLIRVWLMPHSDRHFQQIKLHLLNPQGSMHVSLWTDIIAVLRCMAELRARRRSGINDLVCMIYKPICGRMVPNYEVMWGLKQLNKFTKYLCNKLLPIISLDDTKRTKISYPVIQECLEYFGGSDILHWDNVNEADMLGNNG